MANSVNLIIGSDWSNLIESHLHMVNVKRFQRRATGTPLLTCFRLSRRSLLKLAQAIYNTQDPAIKDKDRAYLLYSITRDILDPVHLG